WLTGMACEREQVLVDRLVHDTVYVNGDPIVIVKPDTIYVPVTDSFQTRLTIIHPGSDNYNGVYHWNEAITEWLLRVDQAGLEPHARTVVFTPVHWGNPTGGAAAVIRDDGFYYVYMEIVDHAAIWRSLSNVLLDIPFIEVSQGSYIDLETGEELWYSYGDLFWYEDYACQTVKQEYGHLMCHFFGSGVDYAATPEKHDWYWNDMFGI